MWMTFCNRIAMIPDLIDAVAQKTKGVCMMTTVSFLSTVNRCGSAIFEKKRGRKKKKR